MSSASTSSSPSPPAAQAGGPRPDPGLGVFTTLLVLDGRPVELDAHLRRLDASARALFGCPVPPAARGLVLARADGAGPARLRLTVAPGDDGALTAEVTLTPVDASLILPDLDRGVELTPVVVAGGIGAHKWADRRLLAAAEAGLAPRLPLLLDHDGAVLEASRGNVFAVLDGVVVTPPADGRILPGIARDRVLRIAPAAGLEVREEPIGLDRLADAAEVFITGAVRGIEPVRRCDDVFAASEQQTTPVLSRALGAYWAAAAHARTRPSEDAYGPVPEGGAPRAERD
jgi:para-aminobenzoate synthetase / 4-amino-4-deoxychorismate lyase